MLVFVHYIDWDDREYYYLTAPHGSTIPANRITRPIGLTGSRWAHASMPVRDHIPSDRERPFSGDPTIPQADLQHEIYDANIVHKGIIVAPDAVSSGWDVTLNGFAGARVIYNNVRGPDALRAGTLAVAERVQYDGSAAAALESFYPDSSEAGVALFSGAGDLTHTLRLCSRIAPSHPRAYPLFCPQARHDVQMHNLRDRRSSLTTPVSVTKNFVQAGDRLLYVLPKTYEGITGYPGKYFAIYGPPDSVTLRILPDQSTYLFEVVQEMTLFAGGQEVISEVIIGEVTGEGEHEITTEPLPDNCVLFRYFYYMTIPAYPDDPLTSSHRLTHKIPYAQPLLPCDEDTADHVPLTLWGIDITDLF